jgi:hypothetical protein
MATINDVNARALVELRDLCGYVENGGSTTVRIFQDDATKSWHVYVGDKGYYGVSLNEAIRAAHNVHHELIDPMWSE